METDHRCSGLHKAGCILLRMHYHKMHVKRLAGYFCDSLRNREAEGDVRHKRTVHHIHVDDVGIFIYKLYVLLEMEKVG